MTKRINSLLILAIVFQSQIIAQNIDETFNLKWKTAIGQTTYRTNIIYESAFDAVIVGSNGITRAQENDSLDGVYLIDPKTGQIKQHILEQGQPDNDRGNAYYNYYFERPGTHQTTSPVFRDADVNGVVTTPDGYLYYGNDNAEFFGYKDGKKIWSKKLTKGNFESCPTLTDITKDNILDVIVSVKYYGLVAFNGKTGEIIWEQSRLFNDPYYGYAMSAPALTDLNNDGIQDVVWGTRTKEKYKAPGKRWENYGDAVLGINGIDGTVLWKYPVYSAIHASPVIRKKNNKTEIIVAETYSRITILDTNGKLLRTTTQNVPTKGISGLYSSPYITVGEHLIIGTSWWGKDEDGFWVIDLNTVFSNDNNKAKVFHQTGRTSSSAVSGDILKSNKGKETIICSESGKLAILDSQGSLIKTLTLPSGVEATPLIMDIDGDKKPELIIACLDGNLYCYDTKGKVKYGSGQFRGDNQNTGRIY